ncbi:MAG: YbhN family protein, partial [Acidimicrobiales bacterium]
LAVVAHATSTRSPALWAMGAAIENRFPTTAAGRIVGTLNALALELDGWRRRPADFRRALIWATLNWVIDAAALWIILAAFGQRLGPSSVLVAFALANLAAMIPLTPGGLGVVELTITATLVGLGASAGPTAIGVAVYRLFNYWMPIPISALTYFATRSLTRDRALGRDTAPPIQVGHRPHG